MMKMRGNGSDMNMFEEALESVCGVLNNSKNSPPFVNKKSAETL